eukprot:GHVU01064873.1.p1 GENE.GHVU01064873.1~~GHVU01064873.1.p1  ORF type:complete len:514 (+),score=136.15 GHVU01064873.1:382-1923(+)
MQPSHEQMTQEALLAVSELDADLRRVKLYEVDPQSGQWNDKGTGRFHIDAPESQLSAKLVVQDEGGGPDLVDTVLQTRHRDYSYQKESILLWQEEGQHRALSFQRPEGCQAAWRYLQLFFPGFLDPDREEESSEGDDRSDHRSDHSEPDALWPTLENLEYFVKRLKEVEMSVEQRQVSQQDLGSSLKNIVSKRWFLTLWATLNEAEEANKMTECTHIAEILLRIITLYTMTAPQPQPLSLFGDSEDPVMVLLSEDHCRHFFKALQYDPELVKRQLRIDHNFFLDNVVKYREVIAHSNSEFARTAHFLYRLLYLRDVCMPRYLDDSTIHRMGFIVTAAYQRICKVLVDDPNTLLELAEGLETNILAAHFLRELLTALKTHMQTPGAPEKAAIYSRLRELSVLERFEGYLDGTSPVIKQWRDAVTERHRREEAERESLKGDGCVEGGGGVVGSVGSPMLGGMTSPTMARFDPLRRCLENETRTLTFHPVAVAVDVLYLVCEHNIQMLRQCLSRTE